MRFSGRFPITESVVPLVNFETSVPKNVYGVVVSRLSFMWPDV